VVLVGLQQQRWCQQCGCSAWKGSATARITHTKPGTAIHVAFICGCAGRSAAARAAHVCTGKPYKFALMADWAPVFVPRLFCVLLRLAVQSPACLIKHHPSHLQHPATACTARYRAYARHHVQTTLRVTPVCMWCSGVTAGMLRAAWLSVSHVTGFLCILHMPHAVAYAWLVAGCVKVRTGSYLSASHSPCMLTMRLCNLAWQPQQAKLLPTVASSWPLVHEHKVACATCFQSRRDC
jgi:hypothetical protein